MKTMTHLEIILWIQENVFEITEEFSGYTAAYFTDQGQLQSTGRTLVECILKANNAVLQEDNSLNLIPRTPEEQIKALMYVKELKVERINSGNNQ